MVRAWVEVIDKYVCKFDFQTSERINYTKGFNISVMLYSFSISSMSEDDIAIQLFKSLLTECYENFQRTIHLYNSSSFSISYEASKESKRLWKEFIDDIKRFVCSHPCKNDDYQPTLIALSKSIAIITFSNTPTTFYLGDFSGDFSGKYILFRLKNDVYMILTLLSNNAQIQMIRRFYKEILLKLPYYLRLHHNRSCIALFGNFY